MNLSLSAPCFAALVAAPAFAGVVGGTGSVDFMQTGIGYVDLEAGTEQFEQLVTLVNPPVGSYLLLGGGIPGVETFFGGIEFLSVEGPVARFASTNSIEVDPFAFPENEWAFAGNRVQFTTDVPVEVNLDAILNPESPGGFLDGAGVGFLEIYGDSSGPFINPVSGAWNLKFVLAAGTHTLAWGALCGPAGGSAELDGVLSLTLIPAPGALALLAVAGLVGNRRRGR